jgi:hypothetical protein
MCVRVYLSGLLLRHRLLYHLCGVWAGAGKLDAASTIDDLCFRDAAFFCLCKALEVVSMRSEC